MDNNNLMMVELFNAADTITLKSVCMCPSLTCMCSHMPLEVKGIIESFTAESTRVSLHHAVALEVASQHALQGEYFVAN